ncbi:hypothetical protein K461DRAFT_318364 [Myriangium duriaei CBS 260.36]|uniref:CCZ1/INTU/HSP4 first Longin domain-containing protein n=1 Tax=Myriangium duriaei CBS 260.36 TaxID=1168546 RepID=A0A9P4J5W3_9PEZI|nr:hypothetical protein K461DRAFT_318364 [Myriangium duriaei CBS 260.36]
MTATQPELRVIPAQLSFLTIYNPSLGPTDETFRDQILFYYSRVAKEAKAASKTGATNVVSQDELREQENERLRQVGLAQGMVDFARTFSNGQSVDSVETGKSRIVMRELESGWWALASIDLTKLPKARSSSPDSSKPATAPDADPYEYSSREVSPPGLLIQQIVTAHHTFLLHHGSSMTEFMERNGREKLSTSLERFWSKFCRYWEVLLTGNPAVDAMGGIKLAAGGELGMGVGEEEWGSGEREVLEDLVHRTEGLVDLVVSRFGEGPTEATSKEELPWVGRGRPSEATDGVILGGTGAISRASIRDVACWVQQIYTYGDYAYGVKDNPSRKRRRRHNQALGTGTTKNANGEAKSKSLRKQPVPAAPAPEQAQEQPTDDPLPESSADENEAEPQKQNGSPNVMPTFQLPPDLRPALHDRVASQDHAPGSPSLRQPLDDHKPGIPPPIVTAAERALAQATSKAQKSSEASPQGEAIQQNNFGISDKWMKYLTLGLSTLGKPEPTESNESRPAASSRQNTGTSARLQVPASDAEGVSEDETARTTLAQLDPMPEGHLVESQMAEQRRAETEGYFLIGYRGQLQKPASKSEVTGPRDDEEDDEDVGERLVLRTIHVERIKKVGIKSDDGNMSDGSSVSTFKNDMTTSEIERVRVLIYIRRPFIYTFLFEQRATSLQMSAFYIWLHNHLTPLQKPMGHNTSPSHVARLIGESKEAAMVPDSPGSTKNEKQPQRPVYDLLYDPERLTIHSSIPNIPLPGTLMAEGLGLHVSDKAAWTRIEALNVHSQILNTLESTRHSSREVERSAKTSRGWWVVWMRMPPSSHVPAPTPGQSNNEAGGNSIPTITFSRAEEHETSECRVAILVRKASDWTAPKTSTSSSRMTSAMFGLGRAGDDVTGGSNASWGPSSLAGGMGFDARRYVEGLLSLNR